MTILVTCDLDSTLCNTGHRQHMIDRENGTDWDAYSLACVDDVAVKGMVKVLQLLALNSEVVIVGLSARTEVALDATLEWMRKESVPIHRAFLAEGDSRSKQYTKDYTHAQYKLARLREVEEIMGMPVALHFDDYAEIADLFDREGIPTVCVRTPQDIEEIVAQDRLASLA